MALRFFSLACLAAVLITIHASDSSLQLKLEPENSLLKVMNESQPVLVYSFHPKNFKPYVKELYTTAGNNVLQDAPADHLHHHGLMYAIRINGVNFWEENETSGYEKHAGFLRQRERINPAGHPEASFTELIYWVPPKAASSSEFKKSAFLVEERTLIVSLDKASQEVALQWKSRFEVPNEVGNIQLHGSGYNGLGIRFPTEWNHVARHSNSEHLPYTKEHSWDVMPGKWAAVGAPEKVSQGMVTLFGDPRNAGETMFFSMNNAFAYLAVTQNLEKKPITYAPGAKFNLNYLVLVYPENKPEQFLRARYEKWAAEAAK